MEQLEIKGFNIFYMGVAVWDSNVLVTVLLIVAWCLVHICLTEPQLSSLQGVLVLLFGLLELSLKVIN